MTQDQKIRMAVVATIVSILGGVLGATVIYGGNPDDGGRLYGFVFTAICSVPAGLITGWNIARKPRKPTADDVEFAWMQRAQSAAFWDVIGLISIAAGALTLVPSLEDTQALPVVLIIGLTGIADVLLRYFGLHLRAPR